MRVPDLSKFIRMPNRRSGVGPVAVIHWDRERLYYFIGSMREPLTDNSTGHCVCWTLDSIESQDQPSAGPPLATGTRSLHADSPQRG